MTSISERNLTTPPLLVMRVVLSYDVGEPLVEEGGHAIEVVKGETRQQHLEGHVRSFARVVDLRFVALRRALVG
eukprot:6190968-Pleurochrysis_carterae.AAC.1